MIIRPKSPGSVLKTCHLNYDGPIQLPVDYSPQLVVVIDTEEEFDWFAEPDRKANTVRHMESIHLVQDIFNEYGIEPCWVKLVFCSISKMYDSVYHLHDILSI